MAELSYFLVHPTNESANPEFDVRNNAVRLFGANLDGTAPVLVRVGPPSDAVYAPAYVNGQPIRLKDTDNVVMVLIAGHYKVDAEGLGEDARIWLEESSECATDENVMFIVQQPAPSGDGTAVVGAITDVGVLEQTRFGCAGVADTAAPTDHVHSFNALDEVYMERLLSALTITASETIVGSVPTVFISDSTLATSLGGDAATTPGTIIFETLGTSNTVEQMVADGSISVNISPATNIVSSSGDSMVALATREYVTMYVTVGVTFTVSGEDPLGSLDMSVGAGNRPWLFIRGISLVTTFSDPIFWNTFILESAKYRRHIIDGNSGETTINILNDTGVAEYCYISVTPTVVPGCNPTSSGATTNLDIAIPLWSPVEGYIRAIDVDGMSFAHLACDLELRFAIDPNIVRSVE